MEGEDHHNALAGPDVSNSFRKSLVDDQRSLHVGDAPVPWELCGVRTYEADSRQLDAHTEPPVFVPAFACCHFEAQHTTMAQIRGLRSGIGRATPISKTESDRPSPYDE